MLDGHEVMRFEHLGKQYIIRAWHTDDRKRLGYPAQRAAMRGQYVLIDAASGALISHVRAAHLDWYRQRHQCQEVPHETV